MCCFLLCVAVYMRAYLRVMSCRLVLGWLRPPFRRLFLQHVVSGCRSSTLPPPRSSPACSCCAACCFRAVPFSSFLFRYFRLGGVFRDNRGRPAADREGRLVRQARTPLAAHHRVPAARAGESVPSFPPTNRLSLHHEHVSGVCVAVILCSTRSRVYLCGNVSETVCGCTCVGILNRQG